MAEPRDTSGRHRIGSSLLGASGVYLVVWAIGLPDWWQPSQNLWGHRVSTLVLAVPWAVLLLLGAFLRYQDQPEARR